MSENVVSEAPVVKADHVDPRVRVGKFGEGVTSVCQLCFHAMDHKCPW